MIDVELPAEIRTEKGKSAAKRLRNAGLIPGVLYGHGEDPLPVTLEGKALRTAMETIGQENVIINLLVDGKGRRAVIKEIQIDSVTQKVLHIDFQHVHAGEEIVVEIPIIAKGIAQGVKEGGILDHALRRVEIKCLPSKIPEHFEVDVSDMGIGDSLHLSDVELGDVHVLADLQTPVLSVIPPKAVEVEPEKVEVEEEVRAEEEEKEGEEEKKVEEDKD